MMSYQKFHLSPSAAASLPGGARPRTGHNRTTGSAVSEYRLKARQKEPVMDGAGKAPAAARVFLSYARGNLGWITNFKKWLSPQLGGAVLHDYLGQSGFGNVEDNLRDRIGGSYAFLAFFSKQYCEQRYTLFEWWEALKRCDGEVHRKGLVFVPILLDNDARAWWSSVPEDRRCPDWVRRYGYEDFTGPDGTPATIVSEYGPVDRVTSRIEEIARRLRQASADQRDRVPEPSGPKALGPSPSTLPVVILGHPTAAFPAAVAQAVGSLAAELAGRGVEPVSWKDG
jgi:TIR domain